MRYAATAPYELLENSELPFPLMQRLKRFARAWDLLANSGNFPETLPLLWRQGSPFRAFLAFSDWLYAQAGPFTGIALERLARLLFDYLAVRASGSAEEKDLALVLARDFVRPGRTLPGFLAARLPEPPARGRAIPGIPARQARHLAARS
jgi:hypothetical protein